MGARESNILTKVIYLFNSKFNVVKMRQSCIVYLYKACFVEISSVAFVYKSTCIIGITCLGCLGLVVGSHAPNKVVVGFNPYIGTMLAQVWLEFLEPHCVGISKLYAGITCWSFLKHKVAR